MYSPIDSPLLNQFLTHGPPGAGITAIHTIVASLSDSNTLVSTGTLHSIPLPPNHRLEFLVTACTPVLTGNLTPTTKIIVSIDPSIHSHSSTPNDPIDPIESQDAQLDRLEQMLFSPGIWDLSLGKMQPSVTLEAHILKRPVSSSSDPESAIVMSSDAAMRLGIRASSFVTVRNTEKERLMCVHVDDGMCSGSDSECWVPPTAFLNLGLSLQHSQLIVSRISATFGDPEVPIASKISVARVAGSVTSHRMYLDLCLDALGDWFLETRRSVANGDVICVVVNKFVADVKNEFYCDEDLDIRDDINDLQSDAFKSLAFFKITDISIDSTTPESSATLPSCFVTSDTRILQSGVVTCAIPPYATSYHNISY
ncbi:hypothetical protein HDU98_005723, partial [Podochytrium sp. JEL0797]